MSTDNLYLVLPDILAERSRQDAQWGGPAHDDAHTPADWLDILDGQLQRAAGEGSERPEEALPLLRARLVKIGAVALAALQSLDRIRAREG